MKTIIIISLLIVHCTLLIAETRYVSKTGTSTPPYISWETASDSIQKAINICNDADTVVVDNGIYKEFLIIDSAITLLGMSMDSTIIDGTGIGDYNTIRANNHLIMKEFTLIGKGYDSEIQNTVVSISNYNLNISKCIITNSHVGIYLGKSSGIVDSVFLQNIYAGFKTFCASDTCKPVIKNSVVLTNEGGDNNGVLNFHGGQPTILNNIFIAGSNHGSGITNLNPIKTLIFKNNLVSRFAIPINNRGITDTSYLINNIVRNYKIGFSNYAAIWALNNRTVLRNNIISDNDIGLESTSAPDTDNNLFWNNEVNVTNGNAIGPNDIFVDPMFVKDTIPTKEMNFDFHLQKYSPAIDAGDQDILDVDGSRSDIGIYGGPLRVPYSYSDLPPKPPKNFIVSFDTLDKKLELSWDLFSEADFHHYNIYRSEVQGFQPDSSNKYYEIDTSFFVDNISSSSEKIYYKLTSVDSTRNESIAGPEISILVTDVNEPIFEIVNEYHLYQNYPNPFNPSTIIPYSLRKKSHVKIIIYDIKGELIKMLVNDDEESGYHETEFNAQEFNLSSGIYLYRIEVTREGRMPVYMQMQKMIYLK